MSDYNIIKELWRAEEIEGGKAVEIPQKKRLQKHRLVKNLQHREQQRQKALLNIIKKAPQVHQSNSRALDEVGKYPIAPHKNNRSNPLSNSHPWYFFQILAINQSEWSQENDKKSYSFCSWITERRGSHLRNEAKLWCHHRNRSFGCH